MRKKAKAIVHSRPGQVLTCVVALVAAYAFGSWAIDTGSYWQYLAAVASFVVFAKYLIRTLKNNYGKR